MIRCVIYARVSTDAQEREGSSLDTQEQACRVYASDQGWTVVAALQDVVSGAILERPGLDQARAAIRAGDADVVLAYAVDRLSRSQNHLGVIFTEAEDRGTRLEFVTEPFDQTPIGRFIVAARSFMAEVERDKIAERTMRGKLERAKTGKLPQGTGKGCYGYIYHPASGKRGIDPVQGAVVLRLFSEFASGAFRVEVIFEDVPRVDVHQKGDRIAQHHVENLQLFRAGLRRVEMLFAQHGFGERRRGLGEVHRVVLQEHWLLAKHV